MPSKRIEFLYFFTACMSVIPTARADVRFNRDVRPILAENCLSCHGPDEKNREADLRLDLSAEARKKSIVAGNPEKSRLFKRVISTDPDTVMPPPDSKKKLTAKQVETLRQWIAEGAKFEDHWAFEPILDPAVPGDSSDGTGEPRTAHSPCYYRPDWLATQLARSAGFCWRQISRRL
jgi:hypothetical protein